LAIIKPETVLHFLIKNTFYFVLRFWEVLYLSRLWRGRVHEKKYSVGLSAPAPFLLPAVMRVWYLITQMVPSSLTFFKKDTKYCQLMPHGIQKSQHSLKCQAVIEQVLAPLVQFH